MGGTKSVNEIFPVPDGGLYNGGYNPWDEDSMGANNSTMGGNN